MTDEKPSAGKSRKIFLLLLLLEMTLAVVVCAENGIWGQWTKTRKCNFCLALRYKFNCSFEDGRFGNDSNEKDGHVCSQGIYYQRVNKVLNGCFLLEEGSSPVDNYLEDYDIVKETPETTITNLKSRDWWNAGEGKWSRCMLIRRYENKKMDMYNRRGRQKREYTCPTDNSTAWREEWQHCCAGSWTEWTTLKDCPICGWGVRRAVRICAVPNSSVDVLRMAKKREFISEWTTSECRRKPCQMVEEPIPLCRKVCARSDWEEGTLCERFGKYAYAGECCIRNYHGLRPSCGTRGRTVSEAEQYRTTTMVAVILGTEAVIIVVAAIVVVMYNVGRLPTILSGTLTACCCGTKTPTPRSKHYKAGVNTGSKRHSPVSNVKNKPRVRVKVRNADELSHFLEQNKRSSSEGSQTNGTGSR